VYFVLGSAYKVTEVVGVIFVRFHCATSLQFSLSETLQHKREDNDGKYAGDPTFYYYAVGM
jgi:hypothetical protein